MSSIIKVENVYKSYIINHEARQKYTTLRDVISNKVKSLASFSKAANSHLKEEFFALKDVSFDVEQGDCIGIIGRNGAGKSTLLKILSRITEPSQGRITIRGRVASLLEVGTGFHPELSGRENIFLNGAILGMSRVEIKKKFDEIVEFAEVEKFLDTPVKRYSSGMYVRLAFAVAAHMEPEILIVDEVLAVGDAQFQKKCLGKMDEVSKGEGRTVLFVSHNLHSIRALCNKGVYLRNGQVGLNGGIEDVLKMYSDDRNVRYSKDVQIFNNGKKAWLSDFKVLNRNGDSYVEVENPLSIVVEVEATKKIDNVYIGIGVNDINDIRILTLFSKFYAKTYSLSCGTNIIKCDVERLGLKPGTYKVEIFIGDNHETYDYYDHGLQFEIAPSSQNSYLLPDYSQGNIIINQSWY